MIFSYDNFTTQDLRGDSTEQLFTNIEADLRIADGGSEIYAEVLFPVAELAAELTRWRKRGADQRAEFNFDSMSFAEKGSVRIRPDGEGWRIGSVFSPKAWSRVLDDEELAAELSGFIQRVKADLATAGIDARRIDTE